METGYTGKMGEYQTREGSTNEWYIQPQAQAVWMGVKADDHRESNGTRITSSGDGNVQTRLGVKTGSKATASSITVKRVSSSRLPEVNGCTIPVISAPGWTALTSAAGTKTGEVKVGVEGQGSVHVSTCGAMSACRWVIKAIMTARQ